MTQTERLARRQALRAEIDKQERHLADLRAEEARLLVDCEHEYADGRHATAGGRVKICSICGRLMPQRDEKLWG